MTYNTQREKLVLPEYGRTIQEMVDICMTLENRDDRQACAESIIRIMTTMNPSIRQLPNYEHRLWDHLAIMSDFKLDIDWPYPMAQRADVQARPKPLKYPMQRIRYRHYGHLTEAFMNELKQMPESEERDALVGMMANFMKRSLYNFNRDAMDEQKVAADLRAYTEGEVKLSDGFRFDNVANGHLPGQTGKKKKKR